MHNQESVLKNETHQLHWELEIQTDHQIPISKPDLEIVNNNNNKKKEC